MHPIATCISNNSKRVFGHRPSVPDFQAGYKNGSHARFWAEKYVPTFCLGVGGVDIPTTAQSSSEEHDLENDKMVDSGIEDVEMKEEGPEEIVDIRPRVSEADQKQWLQLVKVLVLTVWDQMGLEATRE
ncbi:hypothetical protein E4T39_03192 [Aureobasidium subglaciale]|nr:hypothetical protein E4T39_03192 [Aureobasidium subglaciale]